MILVIVDPNIHGIERVASSFKRGSIAVLILVSFGFIEEVSWKSCRRFRYDASWNSHTEFFPLVQKTWWAKPSNCNSWNNIRNKLTHCQHVIQHWVRKQGNPVEEKIKEKTRELLDLQTASSSTSLDTEKKINEELHLLLEEEELKCKQRAKTNWLKYGDQNTKYFHACANERHSIKDGNGTTLHVLHREQSSKISYVIFRGSSLQATQQISRNALSLLKLSRVTPAMNDRLTAVFTMEDISSALNHMPPRTRHPGRMGFLPLFSNRTGRLCTERLALQFSIF